MAQYRDRHYSLGRSNSSSSSHQHGNILCTSFPFSCHFHLLEGTQESAFLHCAKTMAHLRVSHVSFERKGHQLVALLSQCERTSGFACMVGWLLFQNKTVKNTPVNKIKQNSTPPFLSRYRNGVVGFHLIILVNTTHVCVVRWDQLGTVNSLKCSIFLFPIDLLKVFLGCLRVSSCCMHCLLIHPSNCKYWTFHLPKDFTLFHWVYAILVKKAWRKFLTSWLQGPTAQYFTPIQILDQFVRGKKVVTKNGIPVTFYGFAQLSDNWITKSVLNSLLRLPSVDIKVRQISIGAVCPTPHFDPTLDGIIGMYCFRDVRPLYFIIASSKACSWWGA